ncbi:hypothetical protein M670_01228 [Schinkia azotoformans MEV2011]|uniref:Tfp pilus assembly protein PilX n=1 Tax=Schinkia azotoformans MEV2011 TaxID=1348973 RepID=A0A072P1U1_SCHAZ|nr:hypothetical protein [Schinkia azotoformans]KEF39460.1 hypothetical protein M670_01228 [Schinkia azotoformans MEV2011]MEC1696844.1 hypothetical protein [Schinkia azotoformans]MEC1726623.1 hypothetical protein [Schinkia azotoformans]MEC1780600.1 hypothetical protein [Schinkia azotoformans]MED4331275.1 hypothetical protein [Schinkia azotoformans]
MNEKGYTLVVVLLACMMLSLLGVTILGAAVNNVKRTEIRELDIETTADGKVLMSEILAKLQLNLDPNEPTSIAAKNISDNMLKISDTPPSTYNSVLYNNIIRETECFFNTKLSYNCSAADRPIKITELTDTEYGEYLDTTSISTFKNSNYTRIYKISIAQSSTESNNPIITRDLSQNVIISPTPSFLQYAVGSNDLNINGSPDIVGNVYARNLTLYSKAKYKVASADKETREFYGPSIFGTLYTSNVNNNRTSYPSDEPFFEGIFVEKDTEGISGRPNIQPLPNNFVDVNFDETFAIKLGEANVPINPALACPNDDFYKALINTDGLVENNPSATGSPSDLDDILEAELKIRGTNTADDRYRNPKFTCSNNVYMIEESMLDTYQGYTDKIIDNTDIQDTTNTLLFTNIDKDSSGNLIFDNTKTYTLNENLILKNPANEKGWFVVDGDLIIEGSTGTPLEIKANILVNGNLVIKSPSGTSPSNPAIVAFDATVYVNGNSTIDNVNIVGADDKQLVLLSKDELNIVRINEFDDPLLEKSLVTKINTPPNLKAFFYTDNAATLYGVGSLFDIEGGLFARNKLTINAIRHIYNSKDISEAETAASTSNPDNEPNSRFYVEYDKKVITDQLAALPRVDRLQVIVDNLTIR